MIIEAIEGACQSIAVQAYSFTSEPIAEALVRAHARGVAVEIVLDGGQRTARASKGSYCAAAGLNVVYDEQHAIQHNKVMVIDANQVITGSFNFTGNAERANAENCLLVTGDRELARVYEENFLVHRSHARR
jgi:phosphatidylserine/phosphatidylglycerophosphate/cardiolipin synthase-like enzyme